MPTCSRTKMLFPLKWVFSLLRFKSLLCLSRVVFQHERYQKKRNNFWSDTLGKVVAALWNSLFADAVTPQLCLWDCSAVPNGLRLHSAWCHPIPSLCCPRGIPVQLTKFRIHANVRVLTLIQISLHLGSFLCLLCWYWAVWVKTAHRGLLEMLKLQLTPL